MGEPPVITVDNVNGCHWSMLHDVSIHFTDPELSCEICPYKNMFWNFPYDFYILVDVLL